MKHSTKIPEDLSSKILTIGPDYHNHRGGVGAVIEVYSRYFEVFKFIASHRNGSVLSKVSIFLINLIKYFSILVTDKNIKIIHIHGASYGSFYRKFVVFIIGKYIFRKKIIYHIHGGGFKVFYSKCNGLSKRLIKTLFGNADIVICLSHSWIEYYKQTFKIKRAVILPNIIDYPVKFMPAAKTGVVTFLFLGLISAAKGIFDLIEVIAKNKEKYRNRIKLLIGGNGEVQYLKEFIKKYDIDDIVEYLGWISNVKKAEVLNNSSVYVLPSYNEGLPISILESMSYGKPIISTNVGGIPEIVKDRRNGLLITPGDLKEIEMAVDYFLANPDLIDEYGAMSVELVKKHLPQAVLKDLIGIYNSALSHE